MRDARSFTYRYVWSDASAVVANLILGGAYATILAFLCHACLESIGCEWRVVAVGDGASNGGHVDCCTGSGASVGGVAGGPRLTDPAAGFSYKAAARYWADGE